MFRENGIRKPRFHYYNAGWPGWQEEGIRARIRQGVGGPTQIEVGAQVHGHYHIPEGEIVNPGDKIFVDDNSGTGGRWEVRTDNIAGFSDAPFAKNMIRQDKKGVIGAEFQGTCVGRAGRTR